MDNLNELDENGMTPLRLATLVHNEARSSNPDRNFIRELFDIIYDTYDVNYTDESGLSHFHIACTFGYEDIVKKFLEAGHDLNHLYEKTGESTLYFAIKYKNIDTVKLLLKGGANPNLANKNGLTPVHVACIHDHEYYYLMDSIFDDSRNQYRPVQVNARTNLGNTPLHLALENDFESLVLLLLRNGADPNEANNEGSTSLHIICQKKYSTDFVKLIFDVNDEIQQELQINAQDKLSNAPLHLALDCIFFFGIESIPQRYNPIATEMSKRIKWVEDHSVQILFTLCDDKYKPVQVDAQDKRGQTPLHLALTNDKKDLTEFLLGRGVNPNVADAEGLTPLHIICQNARDTGLPEKFFVIMNKQRQTVQVDAVDKWGRTPLQLVVANLLPRAVDVLLDRGADLSNFVFLTEGPSTSRPRPLEFSTNFKLNLASRAMIVVESLIKKGYELNREDAFVILNLFSQQNMFVEKIHAHKYDFQNQIIEKFTKKCMIKPNLSLYNLLQLRPKEAAKRLTFWDYYKISISERLIGNSDRSCEVFLFSK
ncbi:hypothetical protein TKK_0019223 [Trichogramma kaykai]